MRPFQALPALTPSLQYCSSFLAAPLLGRDHARTDSAVRFDLQADALSLAHQTIVRAAMMQRQLKLDSPDCSDEPIRG